MILDHVDHAARYGSLGAGLARGLAFLAGRDLAALPEGRLEVDGDRVFALVSRYTTRAARTAGAWEAHRRYLDIQALAAGTERIDVAPVSALRVTRPYDEAADCLRLEGPGQRLVLRPGLFAVFWPQDAHRPCLAAGRSAQVLKVVIKVRVPG